MPKDGATLVPFPPGEPLDTMAPLVAHSVKLNDFGRLSVAGLASAHATAPPASIGAGPCLYAACLRTIDVSVDQAELADFSVHSSPASDFLAPIASSKRSVVARSAAISFSSWRPT